MVFKKKLHSDFFEGYCTLRYVIKNQTIRKSHTYTTLGDNSFNNFTGIDIIHSKLNSEIPVNTTSGDLYGKWSAERLSEECRKWHGRL
jgi:hypothetical protein